MPVIIRSVPKAKELPRVNDCLLKGSKKVKDKELYFAVGAGGIPPSNNDGDIFKKNLTPEQIQKIMKSIGDSNKLLLRKDFYNKNKIFKS